jgi:hypothetical protein
MIHPDDSREQDWEQLQESAFRATPPLVSIAPEDSSPAVGDASISWRPEGEKKVRVATLIEDREPGARVEAVGVVVEDVAVEPERWTAVAEQSKLLPVTRYRARVRFLQLRPAEIVL